MRLVYCTSMALPSSKAHAQQIIKTCTALTHWGVEVNLVVSSIQVSPQELWDQYGVYPEGNRLRFFPVKSKREVLPLLFPGQTVAYTRSIRWARFLLNSRWLHGAPVVFETHRKSLYRKRDWETGLGAADPKEERNLATIFRRAQGIVCAHETTWEILKREGKHCHLLWYGWTFPLPPSQGPSWKIAYASSKEEPVLMEAVGMVPGVELHLFGGKASHVERIGMAKVVFHPFMPHTRLLEELRDMGIMVSMDEGIKLADYLSLAGAIVAPSLPSTREILGRAGHYFQFGSPTSLALAIKEVASRPELFKRLKTEASLRSEKFLWPDKAESLVNFLTLFLKG